MDTYQARTDQKSVILSLEIVHRCLHHKQENCLDSSFLRLIFLLGGFFLLLIQ